MKSSHSEENTDPQKENKAPNIYRMKSSEDAPKISALTRQPQETIPKSSPRNLDVDNKAESDEPPVLPVKSRNSPSMENGGQGDEIKSYPEHVVDEEFWKGLWLSSISYFLFVYLYEDINTMSTYVYLI